MGTGRVHGAGHQIIGALGDGLPCSFGRVHRTADQGMRANQTSNRGDGQRIFTQLHAVGSSGQCNIHPLVDNKNRFAGDDFLNSIATGLILSDVDHFSQTLGQIVNRLRELRPHHNYNIPDVPA